MKTDNIIIGAVIATFVIGGVTYYIVTKDKEPAEPSNCKNSNGKKNEVNTASGPGLRWSQEKDPGGPYWDRAARCVRLLESFDNYQSISKDDKGNYTGEFFGAYQFSAKQTSDGYNPMTEFVKEYWELVGTNTGTEAYKGQEITPTIGKSSAFMSFFLSLDAEKSKRAQENVAERLYFGPARQYAFEQGWVDPGLQMLVYNAFIFAGVDHPTGAKARFREMGIEGAIQHWAGLKKSNANNSSYAVFRWYFVLDNMVKTCPWETRPQIKWSGWWNWITI